MKITQILSIHSFNFDEAMSMYISWWYSFLDEDGKNSASTCKTLHFLQFAISFWESYKYWEATLYYFFILEVGIKGN